ncbi:UDP-N-acetylmuramoyl-L-alanine--D-glutamate ligase [Thalassobacillus hwangdonensis]|uniref:UDP-N-acetylmuramoylalanine--D-glutamate ligase n=1 Tax=Thalassobacillus hwangdonensis TaxID=546108 RepID=A0ABW3KYD1_9BACI
MKTLQQFPYRRVLVLGLAKSGTAAADLLLDSGIPVRINDWKATKEDPAVRSLEERGAELILGSHPSSALDGIDLVVKNPGIPYENPMVEAAMEKDIPIITEIELAGMLHEGPVVAITGSNGKTTTTTLIDAMLDASECRSRIAGNIGEVAVEVARETTHDDTLVVELSSFQLLGIESFRPNISVLLNIFEAHLDYHKTLENYQEAKARIFMNQSEGDFLVYNADDPVIERFIGNANGTLVPFSVTRKVEGAYVEGGTVYFNDEPILERSEIVLVGDHNLENILAAIAASKLAGASTEGIRNILTTFTGVPHRLQFVSKFNDRLFYNDSKATNILATSKALRAFEQPVILLAGGLDRGNGFDELIPYLDHVKALVVFGETAEKIKDAGRKAGIDTIEKVDNVEQAALMSYKLSEAGDVILLSPACASWDQYKTFEDRGHMFVQAVHKLK